LIFTDEASFRQDSTLHATWSRVGHPPEVPVPGERKNVKILGAIELWRTRFHYREGVVSRYRQLVARDDRPLSLADDRKEREKLARSTAERRDETAAQRARRLAEYVNRPEWQREAWRELPQAFDFRLVAEEVLDGHTLYVIEATPRRG